MKIEKINMWRVNGIEKPFSTEEEAKLYVKNAETEEELIKYLNRIDCTTNEIEKFIKTVQRIPCEVGNYANSYIRFQKEIN